MREVAQVSAGSEQFGRYESRGEIGDGAMGRVHRGFDPLVRRPVAIKTVKSEYLTRDTRDEYLRRFRREAQAAGMLSHPSIVSIFDVGEDYIVMEFVEGVSLADLLKHRGSLDLPEALRLLSAVAEAIDFAHRAGVIHRDIKPANIMVQPDGRPKLMDFGVARIETSAMTSGGHFFGSPSYMAPEQILGGEITGRVDLFSFAIVAYETVTGRRPFLGEGISSIVYRVVHCAAPTPRSVRNDLPEYYDAVFRKALAKDSAQRFPTASALVAALYGNDIETLLLSSMAIDEALPEVARAEGRPLAEVETHALGTLPQARGRAPWVLGASMVLGVGLVVAVPRVKAPEAVMRVKVPEAASLAASPGVPLRIETEPAGAGVWLDGAVLGQAPVDSALLQPGRHEVRVARKGYAPAQLTLDIEPGMAPPPLRFQMTPLATLPSAVPEPPAERVALNTAAVAAAVTHRVRPSPSPLPGAVHDLERDPTIVKPRRTEGRKPVFPEAAQRLRFGGEVSGDMVITENGETTDIRILDGAGEVLDRAAVDAVRTWRFTPARKDGRPVRVRMRFHQRFDPTL